MKDIRKKWDRLVKEALEKGKRYKSVEDLFADMNEDVQLTTIPDILYPDKHSELISKWEKDEIDLSSLIQEAIIYGKERGCLGGERNRVIIQIEARAKEEVLQDMLTMVRIPIEINGNKIKEYAQSKGVILK